MSGLNQCNFIGRLGKDVELRCTNIGKAVTSFSVAVDEGYGDKKRTEWVNIVAWEKLATICAEYLRKGSLVFVTGRLQTRQWDDKEGNKRSTTEIVASNMKMLGGKGESHGASGQPAGSGWPEDGIPF
jgi:single-strand DNA-binding protein